MFAKLHDKIRIGFQKFDCLKAKGRHLSAVSTVDHIQYTLDLTHTVHGIRTYMYRGFNKF